MTFIDAETAYLAGQRLGQAGHRRARRQPQVKPAGFHCNPGPGTIDVTGFNMAASQK